MKQHRNQQMNNEYINFLKTKQKNHILSGFELKESYFNTAKGNLFSAVESKKQLQLI